MRGSPMPAPWEPQREPRREQGGQSQQGLSRRGGERNVLLSSGLLH